MSSIFVQIPSYIEKKDDSFCSLAEWLFMENWVSWDIMTDANETWQETVRVKELENGAQVRPTDFLDKGNFTSEEISSTRLSICEVCPRLLKATYQCRECGCFMKLKVKLEKAVCPIGKW